MNTPSHHETAKIAYGQRDNEISDKSDDHHQFYVCNSTQSVGKSDLQAIAKLVDKERKY